MAWRGNDGKAKSFVQFYGEKDGFDASSAAKQVQEIIENDPFDSGFSPIRDRGA